ncbi:MAG: cobyric acid synthase [Dehalococcoidia bacterium]
MTAPVLMVVGTASSVGKSVLVTALCRLFRQDGVDVAPFKAQNMSNNADITPDGLEIGRAQSEQAAAAGLPAAVEMNPVLLKPQGDRTSQLVLNGRAAGTLTSGDFAQRTTLWPHVEAALERLRGRHGLVVAEGAGSPAEPNLYATDIVNMRVARHAGAATLLVGDIDRGGVFAHFVGTLALLPPEDRALVRGLVINRFRGDEALLADAIADVEGRTGVPVLGVVPWLPELGVADEDAVALERPPATAEGRTATVDVAVVRFPRIANFDDFDPLAREPGVRLRYVERAADFGAPDLVVLPGTKATVADLGWMRGRGLDVAVHAHAAAGGHVLGVCGGLQMLGRRLDDPDGVEAAPGTSVAGLGLLPLDTTFVGEKATRRVRGHVQAGRGAWAATRGLAVEGYEIHMGRSERGPGVEPLLRLEDGETMVEDGVVSLDGRVAGTYVHGLLHNDALRRTLLRSLGWRGDAAAESSAERREREFDRLAATVRAHLDVDALYAMLGLTRP